MNIFAIYNILTIDEKKHKIYVLSADSDLIIFPINQIEHIRFLQNELIYNVKQYFEQYESNEFLESISLSFLDIQNELVLEFINQNNTTYRSVNIDKDIVILCGFILPKPISSKLYWNEFNFDINNKNNISQSIVDYTIYRCA
jgi:hypothetical protein